MEHKLVAAVSVLLPSVQLIVDGQRNTLLETTVVVSSQTTHHTSHLNSQTDIEILRDVSVGPPLGNFVGWINKRDTLYSLPAKESVVADERCDIAGTNTVLDGCVDNVGEVGDTVLEDVVGNLHDSGTVLENSDFRTLVHLESTVKKTVDGDTSITVDEQDDLTHTDVSLSPGLSLVSIDHVLQSLIVESIIIFGREVIVAASTTLALKLSEAMHLILNTVGESKAVVHVTGLLELTLADKSKLVSTALRADFALVLVVHLRINRR
ncbi:hypothetical protein HG530_015239 [Fusarium avenaceum]|nr:hypothetical protein HG530_015239 [Fusarium avenaceum]